MNATRKKKRVYVEAAKRHQTTHWDMDYLPMADVEKYYAVPPAKSVRKRHPVFQKRKVTQRMLGCIFIVAGIGMLALAVALGRFVSD